MINEAVAYILNQLVYVIQMGCYICMGLILVPFFGLYILDAWLYSFRLIKYLFRFYKYKHTKKNVKVVPIQNQVPCRPRKYNDDSVLNKHLSTSLQAIMDKIQEYLTLNQQGSTAQSELNLDDENTNNLIYMRSNDTVKSVDRRSIKKADLISA